MIKDYLQKNKLIGVVGLGYVGLPLAALLNRKFSVLGLDISEKRVEELNAGKDRTREVEKEELESENLRFTSHPEKLGECSLIIVTVPTPIDEHHTPDLTAVRSATRMLAENLRPGTTIVYESTVYPGVTEDICVPIIEEVSGLKWKSEFFVGYSPERVNPGDKNHTIEKIQKVVSGDTQEVTKLLADIYGEVVTAGIHCAPNIKTAEAAKVIENIQRDLNIALMNELSAIFNKMDINSKEVLEAANTKWNFIPFYPGLVGGHCIGVDPYYLTYKAESLGHHPEVILAGRRTNDAMGRYVASESIKRLIKSGKKIEGEKVLICGFTFKENVPDIRNTRVIDIYRELRDYGAIPLVYEPHASCEEIKEEFGIDCLSELESEAPYGGVILAVNHRELIEKPLDYWLKIQRENPVFVDLKNSYSREEAENAGALYFSL